MAFELLSVALMATTSNGLVTEFSFRRRDELLDSDLQIFAEAQKAFAGHLSTDLGGYLRTELSIQFQSVRQSTWSDYVEGFGNTGCLLLLKGQTTPGYGTLELAPSFVFGVIEILLGGQADSQQSPSRELTAIERRLLAEFMRKVQRQLQNSWITNNPNLQVESILPRPSDARQIARQELMLFAEYLVKVGKVDGYMLLALPVSFVRQRRQDSDTTPAAVTNIEHVDNASGILTRLRRGRVRTEAVLDQARIKMGDLAALERGDVLDLGCSVSAPISLCVNGLELHRGRIVPLDGKRAFAVDSAKRA